MNKKKKIEALPNIVLHHVRMDNDLGIRDNHERPFEFCLKKKKMSFMIN